MNVSPISALAATVQVQIAAAIDRDLSMMMESSASPAAGGKAAASEDAAAASAPAPSETKASATSQPPAAPSPAQAVDTARAAAAGRQASMAPLFADLEQALASPTLPAPVAAAVRQILALQVPTSQPPTGETIARAVAQSGIFLEAHLAAGGDSPPEPDLKTALLTLRQALAAPETTSASPNRSAPAAPAAGPQTANLTPNPLRGGAPSAVPTAPALTVPLLVRGIDEALVRASAATPLAADLARLLESPSLPAALRTAVAQVLAQTAPPDQPAKSAPSIRPSPGGGQQPETRAAAAQPPAPGLPLPPREDEGPPPLLKAALLTLRQALDAPDTERAPLAPRAAPAAPPTRDAGTTAQAPARSSLADHAGAPAVTQALTRGVEQAVARQTLHQLASLPDGTAQTWMFELPLATPQGAAIAQFEIERDGAAASSEEAEGWRVRFSIDMEPLGPLHVHLHAGGGRASINVWAERPASLVPLRSLGGELSRAMQAEVRFQVGAPAAPAPQPGRFLDAST